MIWLFTEKKFLLAYTQKLDSLFLHALNACLLMIANGEWGGGEGVKLSFWYPCARWFLFYIWQNNNYNALKCTDFGELFLIFVRPNVWIENFSQAFFVSSLMFSWESYHSSDLLFISIVWHHSENISLLRYR